MGEYQRPVFENWIDRQVREATERGEFDAARGKPLPDLGRPEDTDWWANRKMRDEGLTAVLPGPLAVRREKQDILTTLDQVRSEETARAIVEDLNARIKQSNITRWQGPAIITGQLDVEETLALWRSRRER